MPSHRQDLIEVLRLEGFSDVYIGTVGGYTRADRRRQETPGSRAAERVVRSKYTGEMNAYETIGILYLRSSHGHNEAEARKVFSGHVKQWHSAANEDARDAEALKDY